MADDRAHTVGVVGIGGDVAERQVVAAVDRVAEQPTGDLGDAVLADFAAFDEEHVQALSRWAANSSARAGCPSRPARPASW